MDAEMTKMMKTKKMLGMMVSPSKMRTSRLKVMILNKKKGK